MDSIFSKEALQQIKQERQASYKILLAEYIKNRVEDAIQQFPDATQEVGLLPGPYGWYITVDYGLGPCLPANPILRDNDGTVFIISSKILDHIVINRDRMMPVNQETFDLACQLADELISKCFRYTLLEKPFSPGEIEEYYKRYSATLSKTQSNSMK